MKVVHLFQQYLAVSESWAFNLLSSCNNTEISIAAIYYNKRNTEYFHPNFTFINQDNSDEIRKLYKTPSDLSIIHKLILQTKRKFLKDEIILLRKWLYNEKPDLIHVHFGPTAVHFSQLLLRTKIPFVISFYGYDYNQFLHANPNMSSTYTKLLNKASAIFVEGTNGIKLLSTFAFNQNKIRVVKLGVDAQKINYIKPKPRNKLRLIQIANFKEKKGQLQAVIALKNLEKAVLDKMSLTFLGDNKNEYGHSVVRYVKENALEGVVTFKPPIKYQDIHSTLSQYDIFIHPSRHAKDGDCEGGAPTILLDAQAVGLPVIGTTHCDIPDYVSTSGRKYLIDEDDNIKLAEVIKCFVEMKPGSLSDLSKDGRSHVLQNYDVKKNALQMEKLYLRLIQNKLE
jgi:colanic acid/amylovoran biosynthesis glycosyltransferase